MKEINTFDVTVMNEEVGGNWACIITCIGGCAAAGLVVPGAQVVSAFATVASEL